MAGKFIVFEGCEGVGKSTQLRLLGDYLNKTGQNAIFTREPGGTAVAEKIRTVLLDPSLKINPLIEAYLFAAARADHVESVIKPALKEGRTVICDRFIDSSKAYQGAARGLGIKTVDDINEHAVDGCYPNAVVFLDLPPDESWRKKSGKIITNDRMEDESAEFHSSVYAGFKEISKNNPNYIVIVPDADKTLTHMKIVAELRKRGMID